MSILYMVDASIIISIVAMVTSISAGLISIFKKSKCTSGYCNIDTMPRNIEVDIDTQGRVERVSIPNIDV